MKAIDFEGRTNLFGKPIGWVEATQGKIFTLPVAIDAARNHVSVWEPSVEERRRIAAGQNVVLSIVGMQPPVLLTVEAIYDAEKSVRTVVPSYDDLAQTVRCLEEALAEQGAPHWNMLKPLVITEEDAFFDDEGFEPRETQMRREIYEDNEAIAQFARDRQAVRRLYRQARLGRYPRDSFRALIRVALHSF